jgi:Tol biopolymer transport system component
MRTTLSIVVVAGVTLAAADPAPRRVAFARIFPNPGEIGLFIAAADGRGERPLVSPPDVDYNATWAPDGTAVVFTSERNGSADLYRIAPDDGALERLTDSPAMDDQAVYSPEGRRLVFVSTRAGGTADLWTLDLDTRRARPVTSGPGGDFRPAWSPDGQWIAFSSDRSSAMPFARGRWEHLQQAGIYVVHPDGSGLRAVTPETGFCGGPRWYADSRRVLAYCMDAEQTLDNRRRTPEHPEPTRIVAIDIATGTMSSVNDDPGVKFNPSLLRGDRVAYLRKDGPDQGIHYAGGGAAPRGEIRAAAWSPDGSRVVVTRRLAATRQPFVPTWSRDSRYELALGSNNEAFSPSGDRLAFVGRGDGARGAGLTVVTIGTGASQVIYREPVRNVLGPQWSPDGGRIIFGIGVFDAFFNGFHGLFLKPGDRVEGGAQVAIINADGTGFRELTAGPNNNGFPSMSPDGRRIVYRTFGTEEEGLRIMDIQTGQVRVLTQGYDNFPLWSPRGDLITFSRQAVGDYEVYRVEPDGSNVKRLTRARGNDAHMAWSPDGEFIVFTSSRLGYKDEVTYTDSPQPYGEIFVMRADGSDLHQLTDNQWEEGTPAWRASAPSR